MEELGKAGKEQKVQPSNPHQEKQETWACLSGSAEDIGTRFLQVTRNKLGPGEPFGLLDQNASFLTCNYFPLAHKCMSQIQN